MAEESGPQAHAPDATRCTHLRFQIEDSYAVVQLLWDAAPRTCAALVEALPDGTEVMACHARHSGAEALFLTPEVLRDVGDENASLEYDVGDVLFGYEPSGICQHAAEDASEVAWIYHGAAFPRRWVSDDGDPTNQRGPWHCVDVALNKWGKVVEESGFYDRCQRMPRTGEQKLYISRCVAPSMWVYAQRIREVGGSVQQVNISLDTPRQPLCTV
jgi:hypothetical protein